jgi:mRNA interferase MazF
MASTKQAKRFDIYWADLDPTKGSEIQKTRPCIIVSPDEMNQALRTVMVVPLTSTIIDWPFRTAITTAGRQSSAACDQLRTIAKERLGRKLGSVVPAEQRQLIDILQAVFSE